MSNRVIKKVPIKQGLYETSPTKQGDIGAVMEFEDGRKFVYTLNGATALEPGLMCQGIVEVATKKAEALSSAIAVGDTTVIIVTAEAFSNNELQDGWILIEGETGTAMGHMRKIKSNPAALTSSTMVITVYDAFTDTAATATETVNIMPNIYSGVVINTATTDGPLVGVPICHVEADYYFWLQVAGIAPMIAGETITVGMMVCVTDVAGTAMLVNADSDDELVGLAMQAGVDANAFIVWLNLRR